MQAVPSARPLLPWPAAVSLLTCPMEGVGFQNTSSATVSPGLHLCLEAGTRLFLHFLGEKLSLSTGLTAGFFRFPRGWERATGWGSKVVLSAAPLGPHSPWKGCLGSGRAADSSVLAPEPGGRPAQEESLCWSRPQSHRASTVYLPPQERGRWPWGTLRATLLEANGDKLFRPQLFAASSCNSPEQAREHCGDWCPARPALEPAR